MICDLSLLQVKVKPREKPLAMQPIKINSTEAELPQELQDQSTSGEDGSQVLTFTTKEIREKKPELLAYIKVCVCVVSK